jgi:hypothetical protein
VQFIPPPHQSVSEIKLRPSTTTKHRFALSEEMPLTIYSLSVPRTLGGGDCVLIYKLLARRKGFSRSQVPILGIEDSRPVIKEQDASRFALVFLSHQACAPSRLFCCSILAMGEKVAVHVQDRGDFR